MTTIDLSTPPPPPVGLLEGLPRRVALTIAELRFVADHAGGAPLPFDVRDSKQAASLERRLGESRASTEDAAYTAALEALHEPAGSLARRGLLIGDCLDPGLLGAVGLLATPTLALDLDLAVGDAGGGLQAKAWHRQDGDAVATLATLDGIVFELAWFPTDQWPAELARVAVIPEDLPLRDSTVPAFVDLPFALGEAAAEAVRTSRPDLLPVLVAPHRGAVTDAHATAYDQAELAGLLHGLTTETRGRLRALVADVSGDTTTVVGVLSWVLLADGWRALRAHCSGDEHRLEVRRVDPGDLAAELAPVLAEVTR